MRIFQEAFDRGGNTHYTLRAVPGADHTMRLVSLRGDGNHLDRAVHDRSTSVDHVLDAAQDTAANLRLQTSRLTGQQAPAATNSRISQQSLAGGTPLL